MLRVLPVPAGEAVADLLPALRDALGGNGPALLPVPAAVDSGSPARALAVDTPLADTEDDPADPTALVIGTSGSTGEPKGALLSAGALAASAAATEVRIGGPGTWLLALPAWHVAGLQVLLRSLAAGTAPQVLDTSRPFSADAFVTAAARMPRGRRYVSLVPTQLHRILADATAAAALAEFSAVLVGGAATPEGLLTRARSHGIRVITTYGMSETCGGCVYDGRPLEGVTIDLDTQGRITLTGPMVARGYRCRPGDAAFALAGSFRTDDLGELAADGTLTVLGRIDDVIVTGGHTVAPAGVEHALSGLPGIAEAVVVGVPDPEWGQVVTAVVVAEGGLAVPDLATVREALVGVLPRHALPRLLVVRDALPHRGPGKPDRAAVAILAARAAPPPERADPR